MASTESQTSRTVLLVRPACFGFHADAAATNAFAAPAGAPGIADAARREFDALADRLTGAGVECLILDDEPEPSRPDAVFPNNWVSFHADGTLVLYPMATAARRAERRIEALSSLLAASGFRIGRVVDLSIFEERGQFLEGTGSIVPDRERRVAFASRSPRTDEEPLAAFDEALGYRTLLFDSADRAGRPIYHTNVLLGMGRGFALLCEEAVATGDRARVRRALEETGRIIVDVSFEQMERFACNVIELEGRDGPLIALSATALTAFDPAQRRALERCGELLATAIPTIEAVGGGSVRCMITDVHLPRSAAS